MLNITLDRTTVLKGPAIITYKGQTFYSQGDITVSPEKGLFDVPTSVLGKQTDQRLKDAYYKISFIPSGEVTPALLDIFFPFGSQKVGSSIFGAVDAPLQIISLNDVINNYTTFKNAAVSKPTKTNLKSSKTPFDAIEFLCLGANGVPFNAANRFLSQATKIVSGTVTGTSNANPDVITTGAAHGLVVGDVLTIAGVKGDTAVNGVVYVLTTPSATTLTVSATQGGAAIAGNAAFSGAGTWQLGAPFNVTNIVTSGYEGSWATLIPTGGISATSDADPDVITTAAAHGLVVGDRVTITGATGDTAINITGLVATVPTIEEFTMTDLEGNPIAGNGAYTGGGTFTRANALDGFETEDGFEIDFNVTLTMKRSNSLGTYDALFSSLTVKTKCMPIGPSVADMQAAINLQGSGVQIGQSMAAEGQDLNASGNGLYFRLVQAAIVTNPTLYSAEKNRIDAVEFVATRRYAGAVPQPLYVISTAPID